MSPDSSLCAPSGKDAKAMLWALNDGRHLYTLDHTGEWGWKLSYVRYRVTGDPSGWFAAFVDI